MRFVNSKDASELPAGEYRDYVMHFVKETRRLKDVMASYGLEIDSDAPDERAERVRLEARVVELGARRRNNAKSFVYGALSPACARCRTGVRSVSEFVSLACNRNCWFCFNPNQFDYEEYRDSLKDATGELARLGEQMGGMDYVALTGGEPLLFPDESLAFLSAARSRFPKAHLRLYTSGSGFDEGLLHRLADVGLNEIRFSVKLDDCPTDREAVFGMMRRCVGIIPSVMVEMPVVPGTREETMQVIRRLDEMGACGINLLELCFPLHNASAFAQRGLRLSAQPYRIPYDYGYAGTLPIAGSGTLALELMEASIEEGLRLGVHYCSLENRNTAQIYAQNLGGSLDLPHYRFSNRTFFYETVRIFGRGARRVARVLGAAGFPHAVDDGRGMVMFEPRGIAVPGVFDGGETVFLASGVVEDDSCGPRVFREVGLQVVGREDVAAIVGPVDFEAEDGGSC